MSPISDSSRRWPTHFTTESVTGVIDAVVRRYSEDGGETFLEQSIVSFPPEGVAVADELFYRIRFNDSRGAPVTLQYVVPVNERWPAPLLTRPARPRTGVHGILTRFNDGSPPLVQFTIHELPGMRPCRTDDKGPPDDDPPPTPGVCCFGSVCLDTVNQAMCRQMGGTWIPGGNCASNPCTGQPPRPPAGINLPTGVSP